MKRLFPAFVLFTLSFSAFAADDTLYVVQGGRGDKSGSSWANASDDLQAMIDSTWEGNEIWVAAGIYKPTHRANDGYVGYPNNRINAFVIGYGVNIYGGFNGTETTRDARNWVVNKTILSGDIGTPNDNSDNCNNVVISAGNVGEARLDGFIVTGGKANREVESSIYELKVNNYQIEGKKGGGIHIVGSALTISNCTITDNVALEDGGGIYTHNSTSVLTNCIINNNKADWGGGMYSYFAYTGSVLMTNCVISNNEANKGGGIHSVIIPFQITNCTFSKNKAAFGGGGIYTDGSNVTITNCTMVENVTDIYAISGSTIKVHNSILCDKVINNPFARSFSDPIG